MEFLHFKKDAEGRDPGEREFKKCVSEALGNWIITFDRFEIEIPTFQIHGIQVLLVIDVRFHANMRKLINWKQHIKSGTWEMKIYSESALTHTKKASMRYRILGPRTG